MRISVDQPLVKRLCNGAKCYSFILMGDHVHVHLIYRSSSIYRLFYLHVQSAGVYSVITDVAISIFL